MDIRPFFGRPEPLTVEPLSASYFEDFDHKEVFTDICGNSIKSNKFFGNLAVNYKISYEEVLEHFVYAGGNYPPNDSQDQFRHYNYHKMAFPKAPIMEDVDACVCKHPIVNNCFIYDTRKPQTQRNAFINVGNCCIKRFMPNSKRCCMLCKGEHQNRKNNLCNDCREQGYEMCEECGEAEICKDQLCKACIEQRCKGCKTGRKEIGHYCLTCSRKYCRTCDNRYKHDEQEHWRKECKKCWLKKKKQKEHCDQCNGCKIVKGERCWFC
jgi:hypothetical protein|tara:strand:+ start:341 stop:1141 length:801 start_codon:yes stop_codon:yes gene_type:complete